MQVGGNNEKETISALNKEWYKMIAGREKTEEYRELTDY